jgi:phosphate transport system ATP-binding protein
MAGDAERRGHVFTQTAETAGQAAEPPGASPDSKAVIEARDVCLSYGVHQVLHSISLAIAERRIAAIIGPSGCGKSTLLRCFNRMNDLYPPVRYSGSVMFEGTDILRSGIDLVELRRRVGMVFQRANPFPMSIYQNVAYGPRLLGVRSKRELEGAV